jgi:hypothetical protein
VAPFGANLDAAAQIVDSGGNVLATADGLNLNEFISANIPIAGKYDLIVYSHGGYGDIGQYSITGAFGTLVPEPSMLIKCGALFLLCQRRKKT